jgi:hypothetical protein
MKTILFTVAMSIGLAGVASTEPVMTAKTCMAMPGRQSEFQGSYTLKMKIGDREFSDRLTISKILPEHPMYPRKSGFEGDFEVVGVFKSKVEEGSLQYAYWMLTYYLNFSIIANEEKAYPVYFQADGDPCTMTGKTYSPTRDTELGTFVMTKDDSTCSCE